jgi:hypothetical protein
LPENNLPARFPSRNHPHLAQKENERTEIEACEGERKRRSREKYKLSTDKNHIMYSGNSVKVNT